MHHINEFYRQGKIKLTAGVAVTNFVLAVERPFTSQGGEREADFIPIITWRQLAETCANYLRKGRLAAVEGRIQVRNYENNEGKRVYVTEVVADNVRFLESQNRSNSSNGSTQGGYSHSGRQEGNQANSQDPFSYNGKPIDIADDDLPF
ncbi:single-stranded DNA-binding protein [Paenibacillus illinoisensis]|uniref:single-stranded DNA-binding protein n=1 Tax=Paenibacillus illinoisensis TaxID=59845 RepID=UPI00301B948E